VLREIVELADAHVLDPHITSVYPLERAGEALDVVESGHATGKVVLEVAQKP
jgi:NADPH:quinone reductase-like Zn-dependent oxidoreductase